MKTVLKFNPPKEALDALAEDGTIDAVLANPPMVDIQPAAEPIDPKAPKLVRGDGPVWQVEPDSVGVVRHGGVIQAWAIQEGSGVQVFAKQVFEDGKFIDCWNVTATIDCEKVIIATVFGGRNKMNMIARFIRNGLVSARLRGPHKRANRKARRLAEDGSPHPEPLSPEEELADTVARQKEEEVQA